MIDSQVHKLACYLKVMQSGEAASEDAIDNVKSAVKDAGEAMKDNFNAWSIDLKQRCESLCNEVQTSGLRSVSAVEKALEVMVAMLDTVVREAREFISQERDATAELGTLVRNSANTEVSLLILSYTSQYFQLPV